ncbi:MAG: ParB/RepB/Spo0J family partition protein [Pirellulales bacterium]
MKAAESAAKRTLGGRPSLPLAAEPADSGALQGRRRLSGAFLIELSRIKPDPSQPRRTMDEQALAELVDSVTRLGILQPIAVRYVEKEDCYFIISGERRFQAATLAKLTEVPCWIQNPEESEILVRQIVENWQRADLHPFELADSLARLRDANGYTQVKIAEVTGKSEGEVSKLLKLLTLTPAVQKEAHEDTTGTLSQRHLYAVSRLPVEEQVDTATQVRSHKMSAKDTETLVTRKLRARTERPKGRHTVTRVKYVTTKAVVLLTFRKQNVASEDIIAALTEAIDKASDTKNTLNIERKM